MRSAPPTHKPHKLHRTTVQFAYFGSREWNRIVQMTMRFYFLSRQKGKRSRHFEKTALRLSFSNMNQQKSKRIESLPDSIRGNLGTTPARNYIRNRVASRLDFSVTKRGSERPRAPPTLDLTKSASRHHGGAAIVKLGTKSCLELCKILNRFPIQNRRDQTRQRASAGTARKRLDQWRDSSSRMWSMPSPTKAMSDRNCSRSPASKLS